MFFKKIFKPKIERDKLEALKEIAYKFDNQIFTESNYDFLYNELEKFNVLAIKYITQNSYILSGMCTLHIIQQKQELNKDVLEREGKNNDFFCQYIFQSMIKVIDFILLKHEIKE
ncbi:hypothetical protein [Bernardetia sp. MNP-M8]|uniref:hypothetical protein n=1 Tax=Bernardetia sp. MNP-M8 TaxID=3127470 RepID=UPI0030D4052A